MIDDERIVRGRELGVRLLFGDRVGVVIFLASLTLFVALWRTAFLINDSYTIANGLYAVANGDISMTVAEYGALHSPGANLYGGEVFSRNYGVIVLSLPFLYALRALAAVADLRIALIGGWCLLLFATLLLTGRVLDRRRAFTVGGGVLVVVLFGGNVALATPLSQVPFDLLALQLFHMTVAAFAGTLAYRLLATTDGRRVGVVAAVVVVGGTPLAFWASVPKRHVITAAVALAVALGLTYSRRENHEWAFEARALCYVLIALLAWIHAPEALVLFTAFLAVDVPTAPSNGLKTVGALGAVFLVALLPLFVTNALISGDPLTVPRMLRSVSPDADISLTGSGGGGSGGGSGSSGGSGGVRIPGFLLVGIALLQSAVEPLQRLLDLLLGGVEALIAKPGEAYRALLRSGYVESVARRSEDTAAANLSLLESAPVLAAVVGLVPAGLAAGRRSVQRRALPDGFTTGDVFLSLFVVALSLVYIASLPLHAQVTVRYLFPITPLLVVLVFRLAPVRRTLATHWRTVLWSCAAAVLIGGQFVLVALLALDVGRGEAFQLHALLALGVATLLGGWTLVASLTDRLDRLGAVCLGVAVAATTVFVGFAAVEYFPLGQSHALPMMRALADLLPIQ